MTYEKDGVTIDVTKAMWNGAQVVIALTKGDQTQDIRAGKEPHSDFKAALTNIRPIFLRHMELDSYPDIEKRIMITGVEEKETKSGYGYRIHAKLSCPSIKASIGIHTTTLSVPDEGFFQAEDDYGQPINDPDDYLYFLNAWEIDDLNALLHEAYLYAIEGKKAKGEPDLLDGIEEADDDGTGEAGTIPEDSGVDDHFFDSDDDDSEGMPSDFTEAPDFF